jgi:UDP-N-acetylglucosamine--N-acetylmuramyl-(pentapeptide) pyrophosphoryl-undecaprenol N-acetylglucosamine transferase
MKKYIIAASGTGGHLLPALAIAEALKAADPNSEIIFIGSDRPLEAELIDTKGYRREIINIVGLKRRGFKGAVQFLKLLPQAVKKVLTIFRLEKPVAVIGVGGYVSVLPVTIAFLKRIPSLIHEAEERPGWANYFLSYLARCVTTAHTAKHFPSCAKVIPVGAPLNSELLKVDFRGSLPFVPKNILILGGSQGAESLDELGPKLANFFASKGFNIVHQARKDNISKLSEVYNEFGVKAEVLSFINDMPNRYLWSHLIISRAGASTIKEIELSLRPALLIPLPKAEEQLMNAERLAAVSSSKVFLEGGDLADEVISYLGEICDEGVYQEAVHRNLEELRDAGKAAEKIARSVLDLF